MMRRRDAFEEYPDAIEDEDEDDIFEDIEDVEQFQYPSETHRCGVCYAQSLLLHDSFWSPEGMSGSRRVTSKKHKQT